MVQISATTDFWTPPPLPSGIPEERGRGTQRRKDTGSCLSFPSGKALVACRDEWAMGGSSREVRAPDVPPNAGQEVGGLHPYMGAPPCRRCRPSAAGRCPHRHSGHPTCPRESSPPAWKPIPSSLVQRVPRAPGRAARSGRGLSPPGGLWRPARLGGARAPPAKLATA
jgi:hypothetical protein